MRLAMLTTLQSTVVEGYGNLPVCDVIERAWSIDAHRVDLSATPDGQRIYEKLH